MVDVSRGGIRGRGFVDLGGGNDTFIGFGNHEVYGDAGKDTLLLPKGSYELSSATRAATALSAATTGWRSSILK